MYGDHEKSQKKSFFMNDQAVLHEEHLINLTSVMKSFLNKTRAELKETDRRQFMAQV